MKKEIRGHRVSGSNNSFSILIFNIFSVFCYVKCQALFIESNKVSVLSIETISFRSLTI
jgi:hypothetical protein